MKRCFYSILVFLVVLPLSAQNKITLEQCQQQARENYPMIKQYDLLSKSEEYTLANISKTYLPQFSINGQASYQSEVTELPVDFATLGLPLDIEAISKDQYKATVDVNQILWDGGSSHAQQKIAKANTEADKQQVEITLYQIKDRINQLYFGILAIDEQMKMLNLLEEDLNTNKKVMQSMFANGTITQSDLDQIEVELLNIGQNRIEQEAVKESLVKMLSLYIHQNIDMNTVLEIPIDIVSQNNDILRPELSFYNSKRQVLESQLSAIDAKNMPRLGLFVQGGYGRPGLNMLENKFKLFAVGGVKLTWNFGNLYTKKNERRLIELNRNNVDIQEETFVFSTNLQLTQQQSESQKLQKQLEKNDEIVKLRGRVKKAAESKYKNGVYPINDLIKDINAENQARQKKALRKIQYLQSIYNYQYIQGN